MGRHVIEDPFLPLFPLRSILCVLECNSCLTSLDFTKLRIDKATITSLWVHNRRLYCCWLPARHKGLHISSTHTMTHCACPFDNGACRSDCSQTHRVLQISAANQRHAFLKNVFIYIYQIALTPSLNRHKIFYLSGGWGLSPSVPKEENM